MFDLSTMDNSLHSCCVDLFHSNQLRTLTDKMNANNNHCPHDTAMNVLFSSRIKALTWKRVAPECIGIALGFLSYCWLLWAFILL